jgi:nucleoside-diphosphate-sugar epimerase
MTAMDGAVVVFGGAGFIGRHLVAALAGQGRPVVAADIRPLDPPIEGVHGVVCDVRRPIPENLVPSSLGERVSAVYNLAAIHRTPGHPDRDYYDANVWGALTVTAYCRAVGAERVFFTSSISIYGPDEAAKVETSVPNPESPYGCSKLQAEWIHRNWQAEQATRRLVIVRPAVVFGPGERGNFTRLAAALRGRRFLYPGRRDTIKACGHVEELIATLDFAGSLDRPTFLYNFCYPRAYTIADICAAFHRVAGLPLPWGTLPHGPMRLAAQPFEWLARLGIETGIHRERIDKLVRSTHILPQALIDARYGFRTDLDEGLARWNATTAGRFA